MAFILHGCLCFPFGVFGVKTSSKSLWQPKTWGETLFLLVFALGVGLALPGGSNFLESGFGKHKQATKQRQTAAQLSDVGGDGSAHGVDDGGWCS